MCLHYFAYVGYPDFSFLFGDLHTIVINSRTGRIIQIDIVNGSFRISELRALSVNAVENVLCTMYVDSDESKNVFRFKRFSSDGLR